MSQPKEKRILCSDKCLHHWAVMCQTCSLEGMSSTRKECLRPERATQLACQQLYPKKLAASLSREDDDLWLLLWCASMTVKGRLFHYPPGGMVLHRKLEFTVLAFATAQKQ